MLLPLYWQNTILYLIFNNNNIFAGSLLTYLRRHRARILQKTPTLLDMCSQVCTFLFPYIEILTQITLKTTRYVFISQFYIKIVYW
jgi:hypothetical protein